jgi:hypothetical protein
VKYVGCSNDFKRRCRQHIGISIKENCRDYLKPIYEWMRQNEFTFKKEIIAEDNIAKDIEFKLSKHYHRMSPLLNIRFGDNPSKATRAKYSQAQKGKIISEIGKDNMSKAAIGRKRSKKDKLNISKALTGSTQQVIECPHCGKTGGNAMYRWHFNNCKHA